MGDGLIITCERTEECSSLREAQKVMLVMLQAFHELCEKNQLSYWLDSGTLLGAVRHRGFIPWDDDIDVCMPREDYEKFVKIACNNLREPFLLEDENKNLNGFLPWARIAYLRDFKFISINGNEGIGLTMDIFPMDKIPEDIPSKLSTKLFRRLVLITKAGKKSGVKGTLKNIIAAFNFKKWWLSYIKLHSKGKKIFYNYALETTFMSEKMMIPEDRIFPLRKLTFENYEFFAPKDYDFYLTSLYNDYMKIPPVEERITHGELKIIGSGYLNYIK